MQYFHSLWSASGDFARRPHQDPSLDPAGDFRPQTSNLPTPGKKSCGRQGLTIGLFGGENYK